MDREKTVQFLKDFVFIIYHHLPIDNVSFFDEYCRMVAKQIDTYGVDDITKEQLLKWLVEIK